MVSPNCQCITTLSGWKLKRGFLSEKTSKLYQLEKQLDEKVSDRKTLPVQDFNMKIAMDGKWYYQGTPINRMALVKLFAGVLTKDRNGIYWLVTPVERGTIEVEDAPFLAVEVNFEKDHTDNLDNFVFRTNLDETVVCGPKNPLRIQFDPSTGEPRPYILVRDGLEARLTRSVYYQLVEMAIENETEGQKVLGIWSKETFFPLGTIDD